MKNILIGFLYLCGIIYLVISLGMVVHYCDPLGVREWWYIVFIPGLLYVIFGGLYYLGKWARSKSEKE